MSSVLIGIQRSRDQRSAFLTICNALSSAIANATPCPRKRPTELQFTTHQNGTVFDGTAEELIQKLQKSGAAREVLLTVAAPKRTIAFLELVRQISELYLEIQLCSMNNNRTTEVSENDCGSVGSD